MPVNADFSLVRYEDGLVVMALQEAEPIGGWSVRFQLAKRFGSLGTSSGIITKSMSSGFYGVSGMNILNSGQGEMTVRFNSVDTSGLTGNYAYQITRLDSGYRSILTQGYFTVKD